MTVRDFGWMAAAYEPHWHRIIGVTGSGSAIGECGHFVRGPDSTSRATSPVAESSAQSA